MSHFPLKKKPIFTQIPLALTIYLSLARVSLVFRHNCSFALEKMSTTDHSVKLDPSRWVRFSQSPVSPHVTSPQVLDTWGCKSEMVTNFNRIEHKFIISLEKISDDSVHSIRVFLRDDDTKGYLVEFRPGVHVVFKTPHSLVTLNYIMAHDAEGSLLNDLLCYTERSEKVTIRSSGKQFTISKMLLLARSSVFFSLSQTNELRDEIVINDCSPNDVKAFIDFLTRDVVTDLGEHVFGLFDLASRYNIPRLLSICVDFLSTAINHENYQRILEIACKHDSGPLLIAVGEFLKSSIKAE